KILSINHGFAVQSMGYTSYTLNKKEIIRQSFSCVLGLQQLIDFASLESVFPEEYYDFIKNSNEFNETVYELMIEEAESVDEEGLESVLEDIESVSERYCIDCGSARDIIEQRIQRRLEREYDIPDNWDEGYQLGTTVKSTDEDEIIGNMFDSLRAENRNEET
ncbi:MAG: hypothetical protein H9535_08695, partial [Ignavibacteria bacterium]|nr:hypothetical protein [Ignavibacteria bacterium]